MIIYRNCSDCGIRFRKTSYPKDDCPRCGSRDLWDEQVPNSELTLVDEVADDLFKSRFSDKIKA